MAYWLQRKKWFESVLTCTNCWRYNFKTRSCILTERIDPTSGPLSIGTRLKRKWALKHSPKFKRGTTHIQLGDVATVHVFIRKATSVNFPMWAKEDQLVLLKRQKMKFVMSWKTQILNYKKIQKWTMRKLMNQMNFWMKIWNLRMSGSKWARAPKWIWPVLLQTC